MIRVYLIHSRFTKGRKILDLSTRNERDNIKIQAQVDGEINL